ncbi:MAG: hypothetical protein AAB541_00895 [Patescibacteria group bacterium]
MSKNQEGIAHLIVILILVVSAVVGGVGYEVYRKNKSPSAKLTGSSSPGTQSQDTNVKLSTPKEESISTTGSAAANSVLNPSTQNQVVTYDLTKPYGTLKYVEQLANADNYDEIAYFITPRMLFRAQDTMGTPDDGDMSKVNYACDNNAICKLAISSTSFSSNFTTSTYTYPIADTTGQIINYFLSDINPVAAVLYGNQQVQIYMVGYEDKWVIDKVSVGSSVF